MKLRYIFDIIETPRKIIYSAQEIIIFHVDHIDLQLYAVLFLFICCKEITKGYHHGESERNRRISRYVIGVCLCMCMYMCTYVSKRKRSTCIIQRVALKAFYNSVTSTRKGLHIKIHNNNSNIVLV